jgi:glycosyltransferase involved in cell wall biosynthesis
VVVIVDGPDEETELYLAGIDDHRLRYVCLAENVGGGEARNVGVRESKGEWIAFLDDDDEWMPTKLEKQMSLASTLVNKNAFIACRFYEKMDDRTDIYPFRLPDPGESFCSYTCCPRGFRSGGEIIQTSTLLVLRDLMITVPFVRGLKRGQDFLWEIEASTRGRADFHVLPDILSILNSGSLTDAKRISSSPAWRTFYECVQRMRELFEPKAYAYCIATRILTDALRGGAGPRVIVHLLFDLIRSGSATPKMLILFFYLWTLPDRTRNLIGRKIRAIKSGANAKSV